MVMYGKHIGRPIFMSLIHCSVILGVEKCYAKFGKCAYVFAYIQSVVKSICFHGLGKDVFVICPHLMYNREHLVYCLVYGQMSTV